MNIFKAEKEIEDLISNQSTSSINIPISITESKPELLEKSIEALIKDSGNILNKSIANVNKEHPDLTYGSAILCSTVMNKNDDVFLSKEMWSARSTPINTPFNVNHEEKYIIGHIIAVRALDKEGKCMDIDKENCDETYFDLESDFVIYKSIYPEENFDIVENGSKGRKFVSMECKFMNFDYAMVEDDGIQIIERNESTAFLTKYLRMYRGEGYYKNKKIGRVLRDIRFTGMGSVDNPANPGSEFTKLNNLNVTCISELSTANNNVLYYTYVTKDKIMKIETLEQAEKLIADSQTEKDQIKSKLDSTEAELSKAKTDLAKANDDLTAANSKVEIAEQKLAENVTKITELTSEIDTVKAELKIKTNALAEIETKAKIDTRANELTQLGIDVDDEKKAKLAEMSDDAFASILVFTKSVVEKANASTNKQEDSASDIAKATSETEKALEKAEPTKEVELEITKGDETTVIEGVQKTAAKLVEAVRKSKKTKQNSK